MITAPDFAKKQIVFVFFNEGEKMSFSNDNLIVKTANGKIKIQCTCYRLFLIYAVGNWSLTSVVVQKARRHGFFIAMMTVNFRIYALIGAEKDGNTLLKQKQYTYSGLELAGHIIKNKINNQNRLLKEVRCKSDAVNEAIEKLNQYYLNCGSARSLNELLAYEGLSSKVYFKNHFNNTVWNGRQPRLKQDIINTVLDIGYSLLFTFVDAILSSYGFDTYKGVLHTQFYMRKSLVCDIVEPFRPLIDRQVKKSINLKQIRENDFLIFNRQHRLKWEESAKYVQFLMEPLISNKSEIFDYIQSYYRAFMKETEIGNYPVFEL